MKKRKTLKNFQIKNNEKTQKNEREKERKREREKEIKREREKERKREGTLRNRKTKSQNFTKNTKNKLKILKRKTFFQN